MGSTPHEVFREEVLRRRAAEIEGRGIIVVRNSRVLSAYAGKVEALLENTLVLNHCSVNKCRPKCKECVRVGIALSSALAKKKRILINCFSPELLYKRVPEIRTAPVTELSLQYKCVEYLGKGHELLEMKNGRVCVHKRIHSLLGDIEDKYRNEVLIVQIVKYLEYEAGIRKKVGEGEVEEIVRGIQVSFFPNVEKILGGHRQLAGKSQ
jgi:hypothetical protein